MVTYTIHTISGILDISGDQNVIDGRSGQLFNEGGFMARLYSIIEKHPMSFLSYLDEYKICLSLVQADSIEALRIGALDRLEKCILDTVSELFQREVPCTQSSD